MQQPQPPDPIPTAPTYTSYGGLIFILSIVISFIIAILIITAATAGEDRPSPPSRRRIHNATGSTGRSRSSVAPLSPQIHQSNCQSDGTATHHPPLSSQRKNRQGYQSGRSGHRLHLSEPLPIPRIPDAPARWGAQCPLCLSRLLDSS